MADGLTCFICQKTADVEENRCNTCNTHFHRQCLKVNDNLDVWTCPKCQSGVLNVPTAPRSVRSKSHVSRNSKKSSIASKQSSNSRAELLIKALDEEKELLEKQHKEQELLLQQKHSKEQELISKKQQLIQETMFECSSKSSSKKSVNISKVPSLSSKEKVAAWVNSNAAHSTQLDGCKPNEAESQKKDIIESDPKEVQFVDQPMILDKSPKFGTTYVQPPTFQTENSLQYPAKTQTPQTVMEPQTNQQGLFQRNSSIFLSQSRPSALEFKPLSSEQIAARHVTKDLPEFNGDPRKWPKFLSSFQRSTYLCGFNNSENLERLSRCLKGDALTAVESCLTLEDNLPRVFEILEMLFGKPEYIINSLIEEMRKTKRPSLDCIDSVICYSLEIENISTTMKLAKLSEHLWNPILLTEMVDRLPTALRLEWAQSSYKNTASSIEMFSMWLNQKSMMYSSVLKKPPSLVKPSSSKHQDRTRGFVNIHDDGPTSQCYACESLCTSLESCQHFKNLTYIEKWNLVKKNNLCRTCLKGHSGRCRQSQPCGVNGCKFFHHEELHKPSEGQPTATLNAHMSPGECVFKVVPVILRNGNRSIETYAMLDDCSSLTLISQNIADSLHAYGPQQELCLRWTSNIKRMELNSQKLRLQICGIDSPYSFDIQCRSVDNLNLPKQSLNYEELCKKMNHLRGIPIKSYQDAEIGILIGMNNANLLLTKGYRTGNVQDLIAARTKLGWIIFGSSSDCNGSSVHVHQCDCVSSENKLDDIMKENYSIECLGISDKSSVVLPKEDLRAYDIWNNTLKYHQNRYEVGLLFKYDKFKLPSNLNMAMRRMNCLQRKCNRDPELRKIIEDQLQDYLQKGYSRIVTEEEIKGYEGNMWYLPIFVVRNPNKPLKIRIVWDAAACEKETSLNSILFKGPDLLSTLFGILLRFRQYRVGICGDIKEMFHQIHIRKEDQRFQLFLWTDEHGKTITYAMVGMTFGASCSPSTAQHIKNHNAEKFRDIYPRAVESILKNHYVDDLLESVETEEEGIELAKDVFKIHKSASFHIRNWISNSPTVAKTLNSCEIDKNMQMFSDSSVEKVLGMWWQTESDHFMYLLRYQKTSEEIWRGNKIPTKREVLRAVMSIYDPLGLLSHVLIFPKILLQLVWRSSSQWDEEISSELAVEWNRWTKILPKVELLRIPRWIGFHSLSKYPELHIFTDASKEAYAAVAYLRFEYADSNIVHVTLVSAKSRVAPLKYMSIPRLELMGAVIGTRLAYSIKNNLTIKISREFFWSDSTCVLGWINSDHRKYRPYVAARIGEILESSSPSQWRYVPTSLNIADEATRMKLVEVSSESQWFCGPSFLYESEESWPNCYKKESVKEEILSQYLADVNIHHAEIIVNNISNWLRLRRIQGYVHRFIENLKLKHQRLPINTSDLMSAQELQRSECTLFRQAQEEGYPEEVAILEKGNSSSIPKSSSIYKLMPYLDEFGVMRSYGRIDAITGIPFQTKRPVILPKGHRITTLIMTYYHKIFHHHNSETVINELRQRFVIPMMRAKLKTLKSNCQWCKNQAALPGTVIMSGLPAERLTTFAPAFTCVGLDYFGPMYVAVRRSREKRWGILITCLTTRAVHIELAQSLSSDSCILGLRRFMCRRGTPRKIFSDNATNFKGSSKILQEAIKQIDEKQVALEFTSPNTEWFFIPPASPHMGGAWERMVRSVKTTLNAIFPLRYTPNEELLLSVLIEAENIVNSRPLTYVPLETDADEALTPNHFILGSSNGLKSLGNCIEGGFDLRNSWKQSQAYTNLIWKQWIRTVLPELRSREKWFEDSEPIKVDDIVLVVDENAQRNNYKKGKVIGLNESKDGKVRSVTIQTIDGIYVRPISKLAILDVHKPAVNTESKSIPSTDQGILVGSVENRGQIQNPFCLGKNSSAKNVSTPTQIMT